ncbi:MAG TPA: ATPase domain-containing protein, partial [Gemmatimonadaceae bacterium]|nr:ATPase domain-containing protein [Gemmatimonadaceae bacterium]
MSPKSKTVYRCTSCGADHPKWAGRCDVCGDWNSLVEEMAAPRASATASGRRVQGQKSLAAGGSVAPTTLLRDVQSSAGRRISTGINEFDFVLGGGIVPGSMVLVGGEPGIGKSTLLLQVAGRLQELGHSTLYVSGEESALQVKLRAERLHGSAEDVALLNETLLETIIATAGSQKLDAIVVDSIQTVFTSDL